MAGQTRSKYAKCLIEQGSDVLTLVPLNNVGDDELKAFFTASGSLTTVAVTQVDAGRGGYLETSGPYSNLVVSLS